MIKTLLWFKSYGSEKIGYFLLLGPLRNKKSKFLKGVIGKKITSRNIPEIIFYFDDSIEFYEKIDKIFLKLNV